MEHLKENTVLLFYKEYERDSFFPNDRYLKRVLRPLYTRLKRGQKTTGFRVWRDLLIKSLQQQGYVVHLNNYKLAEDNPHHPVGLIGYPVLLNGWSLPNPAVLGPGLYDHPNLAPMLMTDWRYKYYLVTCQWMENMFKPYYGERCIQWYAGMDMKVWPDTSKYKKYIDVLIYDKIRWNRDNYVSSLLEPICAHLNQRGLSSRTIRYGQYDHILFKKLLSVSKMMIFLCEHETQGMAYQEALTCNVPVLAWDNGFWLDPRRPCFEPDPVPATSVPYFSLECGERFNDLESYYLAFAKLWEHLTSYNPRHYVEHHLSLEGSSKIYMEVYNKAVYLN